MEVRLTEQQARRSLVPDTIANPASMARGMRVTTPGDVTPGARRHGPRQPARSAAAALGVPPHAARTPPALRTRRHPPRAAHQRVVPPHRFNASQLPGVTSARTMPARIRAVLAPRSAIGSGLPGRTSVAVLRARDRARARADAGGPGLRLAAGAAWASRLRYQRRGAPNDRCPDNALAHRRQRLFLAELDSHATF